MARQQHLYRIPFAIHRPEARYKAHVECNYVAGTIQVPEKTSSRVVSVWAATQAEAYRKLCAAVLPDDPRPIQGKSLMRYFVVRTPVGGTIAP